MLLVDDDELMRASTADMLADLGYAVTEAASAGEALRFMDAGHRLDLLITDHLMPGMTGTERAREVRERRPGTPLLLVSGYADIDGVAPDLPKLVKPFRQADLAATLGTLNANRSGWSMIRAGGITGTVNHAIKQDARAASLGLTNGTALARRSDLTDSPDATSVGSRGRAPREACGVLA